MAGPTRMEEFLEKFQTAFNPPPPWKIKLQFFFQFHAKKGLFRGPKSATKIFGLKMTPPPLWHFSKKNHPIWLPDPSLSCITRLYCFLGSRDHNWVL